MPCNDDYEAIEISGMQRIDGVITQRRWRPETPHLPQVVRQMTIMYGIPNCDTVKKARAWLGERGIEYTFHDFRKDGVNPVWLRAWVD